jgi:hypothetical protein
MLLLVALAEAVILLAVLVHQVKVILVVTLLLEEAAVVEAQAVLVVLVLAQKTEDLEVLVQLQAFLVLASHTLVEEVEAVVVQEVV